MAETGSHEVKVVYCGGQHSYHPWSIPRASEAPVPWTNSRYHAVCTLPPEYCEYGGTVKKCQDWLLKNHPDMHERIWSPG